MPIGHSVQQLRVGDYEIVVSPHAGAGVVTITHFQGYRPLTPVPLNLTAQDMRRLAMALTLAACTSEAIAKRMEQPANDQS